jgi:hypothetical protein
MIPIHQTRLGTVTDPDYKNIGNCFVACIASILEKPLEIFPDYVEAITVCQGERQLAWNYHWVEISNFLAENFNLGMLEVSTNLDSLNTLFHECFYIATGTSIRNSIHAVVYKGHEMVHDPHPSGDGLIDIKWHLYFVSLNPGREK